MSRWTSIWAREWRLRRRGGGWAASVGLFVLAASLTPLALGRDPLLLAASGPAILWLTASVALLIGMADLYEEDLRCGALDVYAVSPTPLWAIAMIKIAVGWVVTCGPLIIAAPILLMAFGADHVVSGTLGFLLGTPGLALLTGAMSAMCAGLRKGTPLIIFLCLPLFAPALVFGPATVTPEPLVPLLVLAAFSAQALAIAPVVAAAGLHAQME